MAQNVLFIHGMCLTPLSWERWIELFEDHGYRCIAPAWPLHDADPRDLRARPPGRLGALSLERVVHDMEQVARALENPILIGHSVGGLIVQILVNRGIGRVGVPLCSVAPRGMMPADWRFGGRPVAAIEPQEPEALQPMDRTAFHESFANTLSRAESDAAWERYVLPGSRRVLRDCLGEAAEVDQHRPHAPLLFVSADQDRIVPPAVAARNAAAFEDSGSVSEHVEFRGYDHFIIGAPGWGDVARHVGRWIQAKDAAAAMQLRPTGS